MVADAVCGIEACDLGLGRGLGEGFLEFCLFGSGVFVGFCGLAVELFRGELDKALVGIGGWSYLGRLTGWGCLP